MKFIDRKKMKINETLPETIGFDSKFLMKFIDSIELRSSKLSIFSRHLEFRLIGSKRETIEMKKGIEL